MLENINQKKYRSLFVSITLFFVFFVLLSLANYYMQRNIVGSLNYYSFTNELEISSKGNSSAVDPKVQINHILNNLIGRNSILQDGRPVTLPSNLEEVQIQLRQIAEKIDLSVADKKLGTTIGNLKNQALLEYDKKSSLAFTFLIITIAFTIILFVLLLSLIFKRLGEYDKLEVNTQQETANIMATVSEGLFLIGRDYQIGIEQSESIRNMFDLEKDLEGDFFDFISQYISRNDIENAKDYLELLFGKRVKEKLIADLNPLTQVCVHISRMDGSVLDRFLAFSFKRVFENDELAYLLVSTTDITKEVLLKKELEETKEKQDSQIDLLMSILHVNNNSLSNFFESTQNALTEINETLENSEQSGSDMRNNVDIIFRLVHKIKGDAASLGLYKFEALAHEVEEGLTPVRSKPRIEGKDLLGFTSHLKEMFAELNEMHTLVDKVSGIKQHSPVEEDVTELSFEENNIQKLANTVSQRLQKPVFLVQHGMESDQVPSNILKAANDISIQLVRNSIAHGIEQSAVRKAKGKPTVGQLVVSLSDLGRDGYELIVQDDGQGIDEEKVLAIASQKNIISDETVTQIVSPNDFAKLVFSKGFSTLEEGHLDAGRGVGLDLVKDLVKQCNAKIGLGYKKDKFCRFRVLFPATS